MSNRYTGAASGALRPQGTTATYATPSTSLGSNFTNPVNLIAQSDVGTTLYVMEGTGTYRTAEVAEFYTQWDTSIGVTEATAWAADTYKNLLSTTGPGRVAMIVGPKSLDNSATTTFEVTMNSITKTFAIAVDTDDRAWLSCYTYQDSALYTTAAKSVMQNGIVLNASKNQFTDSQANSLITSWMGHTQQNLPTIICEDDSAILIRAKHSHVIAASGVQHKSAIMYILSKGT